MPWGNPIVGGNGVLIRDEIRSSNYTPGVSGWRVTRDGVVEFADGLFRGSVYVPGDYESAVVIDTNGFSVGITLDPPGLPPWTDGFIPGLIIAEPEIVSDGANIVMTSPSRFNTSAASIVIGSSTNVPTVEEKFVEVDGRLKVTGGIDWGLFGSTASYAEQANDSNTTNGTTTSTSFTNTLTTTGIRGVKFYAPPSGKVEVIATLNGFNDSIGAFHFASFEVRSGGTIGSGSVIQASNDNTASNNRTSTVNYAQQHMTTGIVANLTPGDQYNACITYRCTGGTTGYNRRVITVKPVL